VANKKIGLKHRREKIGEQVLTFALVIEQIAIMKPQCQ
jgi:hypothetical protein